MHDTGCCEVVQANGSVLGGAINCTVLALLDAGVAMRCSMTTIVGRDNEEDKEDDDEGVAGYGRCGIAVLVTESSFLDNVDADSDDGSIVVAMHTFGLPVSLDGLLLTVKCARVCRVQAMAAFVRILIKRKVQREV